MTSHPTLAAAGLALAALGLPGAAAAQSGYCLDVVASICGTLPVNQCLTGEEIGYLVPDECIGDVQTLFELANEADAYDADEQAFDPQGGQVAAGGFDSGDSFGGNLRGGPGDGFAVVGSLPEGAWVSMEASGTWSGG